MLENMWSQWYGITIREKLFLYLKVNNHFHLLIPLLYWKLFPSSTLNDFWFFLQDLWTKYNAVFPNIWAATAFKGATGSTRHIPVISHHISNHERWLEELGTHGNKINEFRGTAFTGWSRYDHYATMCELLPASIPSLALCLRVWLHGYSEQTHMQVAKSLGYIDHPLHINPQIRPAPIPSNLAYPGWQLAGGIEWFLNFKTKYDGMTNSDQ